MNLRVACLEMFKGVAGFVERRGGGVVENAGQRTIRTTTTGRHCVRVCVCG